jgi:ribokinase
MGSRGAFVSDAAGSRLVPGFKVNAVDTTAAGDIFNGALSVALAEGKALDEAIRFANAAAAISVTRLGAQPSAPRRTEIERFLSRNRRR